jgi:hypothetical protein
MLSTSQKLPTIWASPPLSKIAVVTEEWPSMQAFLAQQRSPESPNTSSKDEQNQNGLSSLSEADANAFRLARTHFDASKQPNLTIHQRIAAELRGVDAMLSNNFKLQDGFYIVKGLKLRWPLGTRSGEVVPESHLRLSHIRHIEQSNPRVVHLYAHPYGKLEMGDLALYLKAVVEELLTKEGEGIFGMTGLGSEVSFFQIGGVPPGNPGFPKS